MFKKVLLVVLLIISGCQSVEEMAKWESKTIAEHKEIFIECKAKARAHQNWLRQRQSPLMGSYEINSKSSETYGRCFEEKLPGLMFSHTTSTTSLDIHSKSSLIFYTQGDHLLEKFLERGRKWDRYLYEKEEPWPGYWFKYNEALVRWEKIYKDTN